MDQLFRALATLPEDSSVPSIHMVSHNYLYGTPVPRYFMFSSDLCRHKACTQWIYIHIGTQSEHEKIERNQK